MWKLLKQSGIFEKWINMITVKDRKCGSVMNFTGCLASTLSSSIVTLAVNQLAWLFIPPLKRRNFSELHEVTIQKTALFQKQEQLRRETTIFRVLFLQLFINDN
jgi:hypothetical protein